MSTKDEKHLLLSLALSSYIITIMGNMFNTKRSAFAYGFATSLMMGAFTLKQFVTIKEAKSELLRIEKELKETPVLDVSLQKVVEIIGLKGQAYFTQKIVRLLESYLVVKSYNKRSLLVMAKSKQDHGTYFFIGFVTGLILLLIVALKNKWIAPNKIKNFFKTLFIKKPKIQFAPSIKILYYITLMLSIVTLLYLISSLRDLSRLKKRLSKIKQAKQWLSNIKDTKVLALSDFIYMITRMKKLDSKLAKTYAQQFLFISSGKARLYDYKLLKKNYDKLPDDAKKFVDAVDVVLEKLKFHGSYEDVKRLLKGMYFTRSRDFNAFAHSIKKIVVVLADRRIYTALSTNQLAAVIAHEIGHILDLSRDRSHYLLMAWQIFYELVAFINLKYIFTRVIRNVVEEIYLDTILEHVASFVTYSYGRKAEMAADAFMVSLGFSPQDVEFLLWFDDKQIDLVFQTDEHDIPRRRYQAIVDAILELGKSDRDLQKLF